MTRPLISNHGSETILLGLIALGTLIILGIAVGKDKAESLDLAAFLLVLTNIVMAVQKRWEQRSADLANARLHASKPDPEAAGMKSLPDEATGDE